MTKRSFWLVTLLLVLGLVTMASSSLAQTAWLFSTNVRNGRAEGLKEATGQVGISIPASYVASVGAGTGFTVFYNAPIAGTAGTPGTVYMECSSGVGAPWPVAPIDCTTGAYPLTATIAPGNMAVFITFNSTIPFTGTGASQISITVRVNATGFACNTVYAWAEANTPNSVLNATMSNPDNHQKVLNVNCEPALSLTFGTEERSSEGRVKLSKENQVLTCIGAKDIGPYDKYFCLNVDEEFTYALTSESFEDILDPGSVSSGHPTNGTQVYLVFTNIPQGVVIEARSITPCSLLNHSDPFYCAGGTLGFNPTLPTAVTTADSGTPPTHSASFLYTVWSVDNHSPENVDLCFKFWSHGPLDPSYSLTPIIANVAKYPKSPASDIPLFTGVLEGPPYNLPVVAFDVCETYLLYPYLTDMAGFSSGLAVSNTTLDPFNTTTPLNLAPYLGAGSAVPQSGPCTYYLYANGTTPQAALYTTPTVKPGATWAFDMNGSFLLNGVSGYSIAVCEFQNAHGYAFISYGLFGPNGIVADYLADVLPSPAFYHRTPAGDLLGETAVAPYDINRTFVKQLNYGGHQ